ncbi:hypothetical protein [Photobacterium rosenbergii]|uniref:Uncharacterized protein n=1 Tax=Photobacterium rosenbergii TaxID=294936 RepID=A0ABU3ZEP7_9GAMM|nr:hypothetical protein [Photobacterium rosenbergii]MDV5168567.1 hypothetical protein [Photobacterium rosenbergii]
MKIRNYALPLLTSALLVLFYSLSSTFGQGLLGFVILAAGLAGFTLLTAFKSAENRDGKQISGMPGHVLRGQALPAQGSGKQ